MDKNLKLKELLEQTDALTYINSLQVTLKDLKAQFTQIEEMADYSKQSIEKSKKLIRRADHQYRLLTKLVQNSDMLVTSDPIDDNIEVQELMEEE